MKKIYLYIFVGIISLFTFQLCFSQNKERNSILKLNDSTAMKFSSAPIDTLSVGQNPGIKEIMILRKEQIQDSPEVDINRVIASKVSGVDVKPLNGLTGSSNKILIRGMTSVFGDNNALYIIDGVPIGNTTDEIDHFSKNLTNSNRSLDINPNNIESIEVLKSLAATNIYGSEGRNGVVLITTKTGINRKLSSNPQVQLTFSNLYSNISNMPDYQNRFGAGYDQQYGLFPNNWGPGFYREGLGGWGNDFTIDDNGTIPHPYDPNFNPTINSELATPFIGIRYKWKPRNSVKDFFRTGNTYNASFSIFANSKNNKNSYGLNLDGIDEQGFTPDNFLERYNISFGSTSQISSKIKLNTSFNFARTVMKTPTNSLPFFTSAAILINPPLFENIFTVPRSIDFYNLPYELGDGNNVYYRGDIQHPLWTMNNTGFSQTTNRFFGNISLSYTLQPQIILSYKANLDTYLENSINYQNKGGAQDFNYFIQRGILETWENSNSIQKHDLTVDYSTISKDFNYDFLLGTSFKVRDLKQNGSKSNDQQVHGFLEHSNFLNQERIDEAINKNIFGIYGKAQVDYKNYFSLTLSGRNDLFSDETNNTVFMPAVELSFVPTQAFENLKSNKIVDYLKIVTSYGTSANYDSRFLYSTSNSSTFVVNKELQPEYLSEIEYGIESRLFNAVGFELRFYNRKLKNLFAPDYEINNGEHYTTVYNVGEVKFNGVELDLAMNLFKNTDGFNWFSSLNFTKTNSEVTDLGEDYNLIYYSGLNNIGQVSNGVREGYPLGAIFGAAILRNDDGLPLVHSDGGYNLTTEDDEGLMPYIGNPNPDYTINYRNSFRYKNLGFNFLISHSVGGDIDSYTISSLLGRGLTTDTIDRLGTYILPGINEETGNPNEIQISNSSFYFENMLAYSPFSELSIYDASIIRLQEVSLSYDIPEKTLKNAFIKSITTKIKGYNLWHSAYNTPKGTNYDSNVAGISYGNGHGFDFFSGPSGRKIGFSLGFTF